MGLAGAAAAAGVAVSAGSAIAGAAGGSSAASTAANTQSRAAAAALAQQQAQFASTQAGLGPYTYLGADTENNYIPSLLGIGDSSNPQLALESPLLKSNDSAMPVFNDTLGAWNPTEAGLEATPGYQFSLDQGLKGVQNSYAAKGLGTSGAALKGAADYAQGLASNTYQQQFANYSTLFGQQQTAFQNKFSNYLNQNSQDYAHQQQVYNMLSGITGAGQNAAAGLGALGQQNATTQSQLITGSGAAQAAGTIGSANAMNAGLSSAAGSLNSGAQLYALINSGLLGGQGNTAGGYSNAQLAAINNGGWTPADQQLAESYNDSTGLYGNK